MTTLDVTMGAPHHPVLYHETINALQPRSGGLYVDCTLGAGGHAAGILDASSPDGRLLGLDVDPQALELAGKRLNSYGPRAILVQASYMDLSKQLSILGWKAVDGIVIDLGVSSMQLDTPERGFSFQVDAPLDMRFDPHNPLSAADLVNNLGESELADIFFRYGEEPQARHVARAIVRARPLSTTRQLAEVVVKSLKPGHSSRDHVHLHPATRSFQALRIAVNHELENLEVILPQALGVLATGGRLAVISFHSLEDRIVKQYFRRESKDCLCPPRQPVCTCNHHAALHEVVHHPVRPQAAEIVQNPRSRSARLRIAEKVAQ
jgi:16S rRNA (cytosine1402-N4)-methyltransferase